MEGFSTHVAHRRTFWNAAHCSVDHDLMIRSLRMYVSLTTCVCVCVRRVLGDVTPEVILILPLQSACPLMKRKWSVWILGDCLKSPASSVCPIVVAFYFSTNLLIYIIKGRGHNGGSFGIIIHLGDTVFTSLIRKYHLLISSLDQYQNNEKLTLAAMEPPRKGANSVVDPLKFVK